MGAAIAEGGRKPIVPRIAKLMDQLADGTSNRARELSGSYIRSLIGDLQARRITGAIPPLTREEVETRAEDARRAFQCILNATG